MNVVMLYVWRLETTCRNRVQRWNEDLQAWWRAQFPPEHSCPPSQLVLISSLRWGVWQVLPGVVLFSVLLLQNGESVDEPFTNVSPRLWRDCQGPKRAEHTVCYSWGVGGCVTWGLVFVL